MADILLIETLDGGDLQRTTNDLAEASGFENMLYLAMFGGSDWWGNYLMNELDKSASYQCKTETVLKEVALNSSGRVKIESSIRSDLSFIPEHVPGTTLDVSARIVSDDRLEVSILINGQEFLLEWNPRQRATSSARIIFKGVFSKEFTEQFS